MNRNQNNDINYVLGLVRTRQSDELDKYDALNVRELIDELKNDLDDLEYLFEYLKDKCYLPGAGSYHYQNIKDVKTFDIYHKYGFNSCNFFKDIVPKEQWDYAYKIGYITKESYECSDDSDDDNVEIQDIDNIDDLTLAPQFTNPSYQNKFPPIDLIADSINRTSFAEIMSPILNKLKLGKITSNDFLLGMNACTNITKTDFRFAYDYLADFLIKAAHEISKERYLDLADTVFKMSSYMHQFNIVHEKLMPLNLI